MNARWGLIGLLLSVAACDTPEQLDSSTGTPMASIQAHLDQLEQSGSLGELTVTRVFSDALGMTHARVQQHHKGLPVFGGEAIVHLSKDGAVRSVTDDLVYGMDLYVRPDIRSDRAIAAAIADWQGAADALTRAPDAELMAMRHKGVDRLIWVVSMERIDGEHAERPVVVLDAASGEVLMRYNDIHTTAGTGSTNYSGTVDIEVSSSGGGYILYDSSRNVYTKDANTRSNSFSRSSDISSSSTSFGSTDLEGVEAHFGLSAAVDYFSTSFGRDSFDDAGAQVQARVHYSRRYVNAFWDGTGLVFGDGDGSNSDPLTTVDIAAHEYTHAVTDYTANLTYYGESGALNEATSDIFAAAIEASVDGSVSGDTWDIGEDCWTPRTSGDALRYMADPAADGSSYDYYPTRYTGTSDNAGVHWNSGIANLAFYLAVEGGSHPRGATSISVSGIGDIDAAAAIWYRALTVYMTSSTDFSGARSATLSAATDLYGASSAEHDAWADAWAAVGIGSPSGSGGDDTGTTDTGTTDTGDTGTTDTGDTGTSGLDCSGGTLIESTITSSGGSEAWSLSGAAAGTHSAVLVGPSSADFDLYLFKQRKNGSWQTVASSTTSTSDESASYLLSKSADLAWQVTSYSGTGDYQLCITTP